MIIKNPILPGFYPDPSVCRVGEDYYLVTSSFEYFPGVPIFHSKDLIHWKQIGHCLTRESQLHLNKAGCSQGIYAPTIRHHNGVFYMVTTNATYKGNFFVHTKDPAGEWSEPVWLEQKGIDPSLLFDDDGRVFLTTSQNQQSEIDITTGKILTEIKKTWPGTGGGWLEAPHLYKINGLYYLMAAEGGTGPGHMVTIARSKNPYGSFEPCHLNPILSNRSLDNEVQATGHADLFQAHDGSWWMVFLAIRVKGYFPRFHNLGRETFLAPVSWTRDGWPMVNKTRTVNIEIEADTMPEVKTEQEDVIDNFDDQKLKLCWNYLRNPYVENYSLHKKPGWLALSGSEHTLNDIDSPTFIGRRQRHHGFEAAALMEFDPTSGQEAGITVFMNNNHHYDLALINTDGKKEIICRQKIGQVSCVVNRVAWTENRVKLKIRGDESEYQFSYAGPDGDDFQMLSKGPTRYLSTEAAGGFTGVYIGLYATGNGTKSRNPAWFDWLSYNPL